MIRLIWLIALLGCFASFFLAGCATARKEPEVAPISNAPTPEILPVEEEPEVVNSPVAGLEGLERWEIIGDDSLIDEFYEVKTAEAGEMGGLEVRITVREALYDEMMDLEAAPMTLATISAGGYEIRHPLYTDSRMEFEYYFPRSKPGVLAINERCGCADPYADIIHLFTVYRGGLRPLGAASGMDDADGDGLLEPFVYDTSFSNGLGMMESGGSPVIRFFYSVIRGSLVGDTRKYSAYYKQNIDRLTEIITAAHAESPDSGDMSPMLEKFLYYRAMGMENDGWKSLESDLLQYGANGFPQLRPDAEAPEIFTLEEIVSRARKALGKAAEGL